jgi:hypothetical protein
MQKDVSLSTGRETRCVFSSLVYKIAMNEGGGRVPWIHPFLKNPFHLRHDKCIGHATAYQIVLH